MVLKKKGTATKLVGLAKRQPLTAEKISTEEEAR
jgi:hypothetical protein